MKRVVLACFLGWTIDAFDFFILVFVNVTVQAMLTVWLGRDYS